MKFDTRTVVLVTRRLVDLTKRPPLFHERVTPATISNRFLRIQFWLGSGVYIVFDYIRRNEVPPPGVKQWCNQQRDRGLHAADETADAT